MSEKILINRMAQIFSLPKKDIEKLPGHEGGRNKIYHCARGILRVTELADRNLDDYLAEAEFVHFLSLNGAPVADIQESKYGNFVEQIEVEGKKLYVSLFDYAKGMLIADNGYRYRENTPFSEYFYNTGKALGKIHKLSKVYHPVHKRTNFFDKYNMEYIDQLICDQYSDLKHAIAEHLVSFRKLPEDSKVYGLVHFDLANLWVHGWGWCMTEADIEKRKEIMEDYFDAILKGYRSETDVSEELLEKLPLFINMVLIENIVDEFECSRRTNEVVEYEDIADAAECLINKIPYAGFFTN